jgi:hypothetical protein
LAIHLSPSNHMCNNSKLRRGRVDQGWELLCWLVGPLYCCTTLAKLISGSGGAGLVGGALLMDAIEDHDDHEREEGYDQGQSLSEKFACPF